MSDKTNYELGRISQLLNDYRTKYPSAWTTTNPLYVQAQNVDAEMNKRQQEGNMSEDSQSVLDQQAQDRDQEQQELANPGHTGNSDAILGDSSVSASHTLAEIITEGKSFIGKGTSPIDEASLKEASDTFYNILLGIGIALALLIGVYLGIKFMTSTVDDKAKVKEALVPYIAGCVVIFGAFTIWKLVVTIFNGLA